MNETTELIMKQLNSKKVHAETHEVGGGDEIDALKLKNISDFVTKTGDFAGTWNGLAMTSTEPGLSTAFNVLKADYTQRGINVMSAPYNAKGDGGTDDSPAIQAAINYAASNNVFLYFPRRTYLLKNTLTIPQGCKIIDFNFSSFNYQGAAGTYCISGGSPDGVTGGYTGADWKNLYINGTGTKVVHGMDIRRIRESKFENILIWNTDIAIQMNYSTSNTFNFCKIMTSNIGIITGEYSNAVNFRQLSVSACTVGIKLGTTTYGNGSFGVVIDNESLFQQCTTAIELNMINQASIINSYFEGNGLNFKINQLADPNNGLYNFSVENCLIDLGLGTSANLMVIADSARQLYAKFTGCRFTGNLTGTLFERVGGLANYGNWVQLIFKNNTFANNAQGQLLNVFPSNFRFSAVECDIPYSPTINAANWATYLPIKIICLGGNMFELTGSVSRVNGYAGSSLFSGIPYSMTSDTKIFNFQALQTPNGGGGTIKQARVEITNLQSVSLYTADTTDLNNIHLSIRYRTI